MAGLLLLSACSKDDINYFPSKESALEEFVQSEAIEGSIDMVITQNNEKILVTQQDNNSYFIGELLEEKKGFAANRISANSTMELGGGWEFKTIANHKHTIYFDKEQENQYYFPLTNGDYYISIVEGHQIQSRNEAFESSIKEIKALKK